VVGILKMDKNICPFFDFHGKNLAKKSTISILQHYPANYRKNNSNLPLQWFLPYNASPGHF